jgi:hypothetical protein
MNFLRSVVDNFGFVVSFAVFLLGYYYAELAGKEISEKNYSNATIHAYFALLLGVAGVVALVSLCAFI